MTPNGQIAISFDIAANRERFFKKRAVSETKENGAEHEKLDGNEFHR